MLVEVLVCDARSAARTGDRRLRLFSTGRWACAAARRSRRCYETAQGKLERVEELVTLPLRANLIKPKSTVEGAVEVMTKPGPKAIRPER